MSEYTVETRNRNGAKESFVVKAVTRTVALADFKRDHPEHTVLNVVEVDIAAVGGASCGRARSPRAGRSPSALRGVVAGLTVIVVAVLAYALFKLHRGELQLKPKDSRGSITITPSRAD